MTTDDDDAEPLRLTLEELALPEPRPGVPFAEAEDRHAEDILTENRVPLTASGLQAAFDSGIELLQDAAARVAGARGERSVVDALRKLLAGNGDTVRSAAAYALARLGEEDGVPALRACLELPVEAYLAPVQAAGSLAPVSVTRSASESSRPPCGFVQLAGPHRRDQAVAVLRPAGRRGCARAARTGGGRPRRGDRPPSPLRTRGTRWL